MYASRLLLLGLLFLSTSGAEERRTRWRPWIKRPSAPSRPWWFPLPATTFKPTSTQYGRNDPAEESRSPTLPAKKTLFPTLSPQARTPSRTDAPTTPTKSSTHATPHQIPSGVPGNATPHTQTPSFSSPYATSSEATSTPDAPFEPREESWSQSVPTSFPIRIEEPTVAQQRPETLFPTLSPQARTPARTDAPTAPTKSPTHAASLHFPSGLASIPPASPNLTSPSLSPTRTAARWRAGSSPAAPTIPLTLRFQTNIELMDRSDAERRNAWTLKSLRLPNTRAPGLCLRNNVVCLVSRKVTEVEFSSPLDAWSHWNAWNSDNPSLAVNVSYEFNTTLAQLLDVDLQRIDASVASTNLHPVAQMNGGCFLRHLTILCPYNERPWDFLNVLLSLVHRPLSPPRPRIQVRIGRTRHVTLCPRGQRFHRGVCYGCEDLQRIARAECWTNTSVAFPYGCTEASCTDTFHRFLTWDEVCPKRTHAKLLCGRQTLPPCLGRSDKHTPSNTNSVVTFRGLTSNASNATELRFVVDEERLHGKHGLAIGVSQEKAPSTAQCTRPVVGTPASLLYPNNCFNIARDTIFLSVVLTLGTATCGVDALWMDPMIKYQQQWASLKILHTNMTFEYNLGSFGWLDDLIEANASLTLGLTSAPLMSVCHVSRRGNNAGIECEDTQDDPWVPESEELFLLFHAPNCPGTLGVRSMHFYGPNIIDLSDGWPPQRSPRSSNRCEIVVRAGIPILFHDDGDSIVIRFSVEFMLDNEEASIEEERFNKAYSRRLRDAVGDSYVLRIRREGKTPGERPACGIECRLLIATLLLVAMGILAMLFMAHRFFCRLESRSLRPNITSLHRGYTVYRRAPSRTEKSC